MSREFETRIRTAVSEPADNVVHRTIELNKTVEEYSYVLISKEISLPGQCYFGEILKWVLTNVRVCLGLQVL